MRLWPRRERQSEDRKTPTSDHGNRGEPRGRRSSPVGEAAVTAATPTAPAGRSATIFLWEQLTDEERARVMGEQARVYGWPFSEEHLSSLFWVRDGKETPRARGSVSVEDVRAGRLP